ncbi:MAG: membrane protein insertion efficiency factor YidD, partial [Acidimicrobiales bacterium]|nr:membrane protein insertion efficiency factor YidD [Acidimicrobiales bacterium]
KPSPCRFTPSCSNYALEALEKHGFFKGTALSARRIFRCHPFGAFGHDPVPD